MKTQRIDWRARALRAERNHQKFREKVKERLEFIIYHIDDLDFGLAKISANILKNELTKGTTK